MSDDDLLARARQRIENAFGDAMIVDQREVDAAFAAYEAVARPEPLLVDFCGRCGHGRSLHPAGPCRFGSSGVQCHCPSLLEPNLADWPGARAALAARPEPRAEGLPPLVPAFTGLHEWRADGTCRCGHVATPPAPAPLDVDAQALRLALRAEMGWSVYEIEDFLDQHHLTKPLDEYDPQRLDGEYAALAPEQPE